MPREEFTAATKAAAALRAGGHCECCLIKILGVPEYDHVLPCGLGGDNSLENCQVLCGKCHRLKTADDRKPMAKADRLKRKREGRERRKGRPMPGTYASGIKIPMNGGWEKR